MRIKADEENGGVRGEKGRYEKEERKIDR